MERLRRDAVLIRLIEALRKKGSGCGETHIQKSVYFLQALAGAETGFDFILYKHGPFSFDLRDELTAMRANSLVALEVQAARYGPSVAPLPAAERLCERFPRTLRAHESSVAFVASKVGSKTVGELERLATALYVSRQSEHRLDINECAQEIHKLKPHIPVVQGAEAAGTVREWEQEAATLRHGATQSG